MTSYAVLRDRLLWVISVASIALLLFMSQLDTLVTAGIAAALLIAALALAPVRRPIGIAAGIGIAVAIVIGLALRSWV